MKYMLLIYENNLYRYYRDIFHIVIFGKKSFACIFAVGLTQNPETEKSLVYLKLT